MSTTYTRDQRHRYLDFLGAVGERWLEVFDGNTEFYSAAYWDLLKEVWRHDTPVRKTDALGFMISVKSPHTAGKYIESALAYGFLIETDNPKDARSKLISLSPEMRAKLDTFFDAAVTALHETSADIQSAS